jgi:SH3-like domain-containing protein
LITKTTFLKKIPSNSSNSIAKLLPNLLINIIKCEEKWCKIEIVKDKIYVGWVQRVTIWGSTKN